MKVRSGLAIVVSFASALGACGTEPMDETLNELVNEPASPTAASDGPEQNCDGSASQTRCQVEAAAALARTAPSILSESISVSVGPGTQSGASGFTATWNAGEYNGKKPMKVTFNYGDGTSKTFSSSSEGWTFTHLFRAPCTARSTTYTQKLTVVGANGGTGTAYTKTVVTYSGPLCSRDTDGSAAASVPEAASVTPSATQEKGLDPVDPATEDFACNDCVVSCSRHTGPYHRGPHSNCQRTAAFYCADTFGESMRSARCG